MRPLVVLDGLIQQLSDSDRLEVARLNVGPFENINVVSPIVVPSRSFVRLVGPSPNTNVAWFFGGQEGDVLFMAGVNIRFKSYGNLLISNNYQLNNNQTLIWLYSGSVWAPFGD